MLELANWHFGAIASLFVAYALPLLTSGLACAYQAARVASERKHARHARRAAEDESATLDVGDTILRGRVQYASDQTFAARTTLVQDGSEAESSGSWTVSWKEVGRSTEVVPFYVLHASGERVRVEPGENVQLASELVFVSRVDPTTRHRIARIAADEEVWVTGMLVKGHDPEHVGGYRDGRAWVMHAPRREPMVIATVLPETHFVKNAARAFLFAILFGMLFVAMMLSHAQYHALVLGGVPATATVTNKVDIQGDDNDTYRLDVSLRTATGKQATDGWPVTWTTFNQAHVGEEVPAIASFGVIATSLPGREPQALFVSTLLTFIAWLLLFTLAFAFGRSKTWYEGARVDDSQSGRLDD